MTERKTLECAKMYMEKLANGINPIDGSTISDEDVVNNVRLSRCFFYVADVLRQVIDNGGIVPQKKPKKEPFSLPIEKRKGFAFSNVPITISELVKRINDLAADENMNKLTTPIVTDWLVSVNILANQINAEGKTVKRPSPQGRLWASALRYGQASTVHTLLSYTIVMRSGLSAIIWMLHLICIMQKQKTKGSPGAPNRNVVCWTCIGKVLRLAKLPSR